MTRKEQIIQEALRIHNDDDISKFVAGAEWADKTPSQEFEAILQVAKNSLKTIAECTIPECRTLAELAKITLGGTK